MATSGDLLPATSGDFSMATDIPAAPTGGEKTHLVCARIAACQ